MSLPGLTEILPTQFVLGMKEVDAKVIKIKAMSKSDLAKYCESHSIPVVKGPKKTFYMIDHHHFARACWEVGVRDYQIEVVADLSDLKERDFWITMKSRGWTYLYDQFGMGPHSTDLLPASIRTMGDDPYRSLAWMLVDKKIIKKVKVPFYEFQWAQFMRSNLKDPLFPKSDFKEALNESIKLVESSLSEGLPGRA